ncbi:MAG: hypothetical protein U1F67_20425 [Rubrivivax sp.]
MLTLRLRSSASSGRSAGGEDFLLGAEAVARSVIGEQPLGAGNCCNLLDFVNAADAAPGRRRRSNKGDICTLMGMPR